LADPNRVFGSTGLFLDWVIAGTPIAALGPSFLVTVCT